MPDVPYRGSTEARYYNPKYIEITVEGMHGTSVNGMPVTLSRAYKLYKELEVALKEANYPPE